MEVDSSRSWIEEEMNEIRSSIFHNYWGSSKRKRFVTVPTLRPCSRFFGLLVRVASIGEEPFHVYLKFYKIIEKISTKQEGRATKKRKKEWWRKLPVRTLSPDTQRVIHPSRNKIGKRVVRFIGCFLVFELESNSKERSRVKVLSWSVDGWN